MAADREVHCESALRHKHLQGHQQADNGDPKFE